MATTKKPQEINVETNEPVDEKLRPDGIIEVESKELIQPGPVELVPAAPLSQSDQFLSTIQAAASDPTVDMDKMERLYNMYEKVKGEEGRVAYNKAMSLCQGEMPVIPKIHHNDQTDSMYAKLEDIIKIIKPVYTRHGFSVSLYAMDDAPDGFIKCGCDVSHADGDTRHFNDVAPIDDKGIKGSVNKTQIHGRESAKAYAKRSLISMVFALEIGGAVSADDDGNAAGSGEVLHINDEQIAELEALVKDGGLDETVTLAYIGSKTGIEAYASIKAGDYKAIHAILAKKVDAKKAQQEDKA